MEHLFYFVAILFAIYELYYLSSVRERVEEAVNYEVWRKDNKDVKYDDMPEDIKKYAIKISLIGFPLLIWLFVGLLTSQWVLFLAFIIYTITLVFIKGYFKSDLKIRLFLSYLDTVVGFLFCILLLINKYHLNIDFFEYFKSII